MRDPAISDAVSEKMELVMTCMRVGTGNDVIPRSQHALVVLLHILLDLSPYPIACNALAR